MNEIIDKYKELLEIEVHQSDKYQKYLKLNEVMQNYVSKIKDIEYLIEKAKNEDDYLKASELINEKDKLEGAKVLIDNKIKSIDLKSFLPANSIEKIKKEFENEMYLKANQLSKEYIESLQNTLNVIRKIEELNKCTYKFQTYLETTYKYNSAINVSVPYNQELELKLKIALANIKDRI